jgi:hypothetical protein
MIGMISFVIFFISFVVCKEHCIGDKAHTVCGELNEESGVTAFRSIQYGVAERFKHSDVKPLGEKTMATTSNSIACYQPDPSTGFFARHQSQTISHKPTKN